DQLAEAADDQAAPAPELCHGDPHRRAEVVAGVAVGLLQLADAECAARLAHLGLRPERGARAGRGTVRVANPQLDGLAGVRPERTLDGLAAEQVELLAVDRVDLIA